MNKILVEVVVPATGKKYEIWVYSYMKISQVLALLKQYINSDSEGQFCADENTIVCNVDGVPIDGNISIREAGFINSSRMILI